jgi:lysophospholipase L1-like esterase
MAGSPIREKRRRSMKIRNFVLFAALIPALVFVNGCSGSGKSESIGHQINDVSVESEASAESKGEVPTDVSTEAPTAEPTATPTAAPTAEPEQKLYEIPREVNEEAYLKILDVPEGTYTLTADVSGMACYKEGAVYQVTLLKNDGSFEEFDLTEADGKIEINVKDALKAEISPVFRFVFGKRTNTPEPSEINVQAADKYTLENDYGFLGEVETLKNGVHFKGTEPCFIVRVPEGFYNVTLIKAGDSRSLVLIDGEALGCNVGIQGAGGRRGLPPVEYYMEDALASDGTLRLSLGEKDFNPGSLEIRRSSTLKPRKPHLYLAGDSTCSAYYPLESAEPQSGRFQTGWGQVLCHYITDGTAITNLGSGGTCAKTWHDIAFGGVLHHSQPGDYFIIMHGINDQSYSSVEEMKQYLSSMIDECREKGVIPVLCTPMQTAKFWRSDKGKDLSEFEAPLGGGKAAFMKGIREVAKEKGTFLIDVAAITSEQYGILGRTYVAHNYHLYNTGSGKEEDTLHLSYAGAKNVASIIATELYRLQEAGTADSLGKRVTGLTFNSVRTETITYTDKDGNESEYKTERITGIYRPYAVSPFKRAVE